MEPRQPTGPEHLNGTSQDDHAAIHRRHAVATRSVRATTARQVLASSVVHAAKPAADGMLVADILDTVSGAALRVSGLHDTAARMVLSWLWTQTPGRTTSFAANSPTTLAIRPMSSCTSYSGRSRSRCGSRGRRLSTPSSDPPLHVLREFSDLVQITDSKSRPVRLSHTHRFRHTKLTRLAELGLPVHVLQRYAGHATPTMTMHYIAARQEHAEQAFLATAKLRADGTPLQFSRDNHDSLHLFQRTDRFLPNGWCLLPPLQSCEKGNACLTCSVFVIDATHRSVLQRQLQQTTELILRTTAAFEQRHGQPMPADNVWLAHRQAEHAALTRPDQARRPPRWPAPAARATPAGPPHPPAEPAQRQHRRQSLAVPQHPGRPTRQTGQH